MANKKISALNSITGAQISLANDLFAVVDVSAGETKKGTVEAARQGMGLAPANTPNFIGVSLGTATPGSITGLAGEINIDAGDVDKHVNINASGTGEIRLGSNVRLIDTAGANIGVIYKGVDRFIHNYYEPGSIGINTFVGVEAGNLTSITTGGGATSLGSYNTGIGSHSLQYLTTGFNNTGLGENTLNGTTSGANNTAAGAGAMIYNTTGGKNVAAGVQALYNNTTGTENVAVGYWAGYTETPANANVTGGGNVWIGTEAGPGSTTQLDNTICIGRQAHVTASNTIMLGNSSHTRTTLRGDILVGSTTAGTGKLQVTDTVNPQLLLQYDASNYMTITVGNTGIPIFRSTGSGNSIRFEDNVGINIAAQAANSLTVDNGAANGVGIRVTQTSASGTPNGIYVTAIGAATENVALKLAASGAVTNYAILTQGGLSVFGAQMASTATTPPALGAGATTLAVTSNTATVTGHGGGNILATITGGISGMLLTLIFTDANVTITDTAAGTADTVNLSAAFTSAANTTLTLRHNGTKWFEVARSVN